METPTARANQRVAKANSLFHNPARRPNLIWSEPLFLNSKNTVYWEKMMNAKFARLGDRLQSMLAFFQERPTSLVLASLGAAVSAIILIIYSPYIFSSFLYIDDIPQLTPAVLGLKRELPTNFALYAAIDAVGKSGSFAAIKVFGGLFQPATAVLIALILIRVGAALPIAAAAAFFISTYPIALDQPFFVTGAHTVMGLFWVLCAFYAFLCAYEEKTRRFLALIALSYALIVVAAAFSPTMMILTLGPFLWLLAALIFRRASGVQLAITGAVAALLAGLYIFHYLSQHQYQNMTGWISYSPQQIFKNLRIAIEMILDGALDAPLPLAILYVLSAAGSAAIALKPLVDKRLTNGSGSNVLNGEERSKLSIFVIACAISAALAFGPVAIISYFRDRYVVAPFVLAMLAITAPLVYVGSRNGKRWRWALFSMLIALAGLNLWLRNEEVENRFAPYLATHERIAGLVANEASNWPERAQIVIFLDDRAPFVTGGYKGPGSWYLRALTRRSDLVGLIGPKKGASGSPFAEGSSLAGDQYWTVAKGRATRKKMFGLESGRPLFGYDLGDSKTHGAATMIFPANAAPLIVPPGGVPAKSASPAACDIGGSSTIVWPAKVEAAKNVQSLRDDGALQSGALTFVLDGKSKHEFKLGLRDGECVRIQLSMIADAEVDERSTHSESFPPMPLVTSSLALYQLPGRYRISERSGATVDASFKGDGLELEFYGREGVGYLMRANDVWRVLETKSISGEWTFAKGSNRRYWKGEIRNLSVAIDGRDATAERFTTIE